MDDDGRDLNSPYNPDEDPRVKAQRKAAEIAALPYWYDYESFIQECHRRNTHRRTRDTSGCCYICGRHHSHTTTEGNPKKGFRCAYCQNEIYQIVRQHQNLSHEEKMDIWLREDLERIVALDLSDGVITIEQAREDYQHINEIVKKEHEKRVRSEELRLKSLEEREQSLQAVSQAITGTRQRISSDV